MFTDAVVDLVEAGVVTGARKERNRGKIVTAFLMGTRRLYDFVDDNPMVEMRSVDFTNDTQVIRSFSTMTAINSAIEVDLTGQVVADSIGSRIYSGVGGQMDFIRGAALRPRGRAIIALPSTAAGGTVSRISPALASAPAWSRPGPTSGRSSPNGAWPSSSAGASASGRRRSSASLIPTTASVCPRRRVGSASASGMHGPTVRWSPNRAVR